MEYHLRAITLDRKDVGEKDVFAVLFSLERGRVPVIVRGTKKTVSSLRPATDLLNEGEAFVVTRKGTDLLTEWIPLESFSAVKTDLRKLALAGYFARLASRVSTDFQPEPQLYRLLRNTLLLLQKCNTYGIIKLVFEWGILSISGLLFDIEHCVNCGNPLDSRKKFMLDAALGGLVCAHCSQGAENNMDIFLSLKSTALGKKTNEVFHLVSGVILEGEEQISSIVHHIEKLQSRNRDAHGAAVAELQRALTRFLQFHVDDSVSAWMIRT